MKKNLARLPGTCLSLLANPTERFQFCTHRRPRCKHLELEIHRFGQCWEGLGFALLSQTPLCIPATRRRWAGPRAGCLPLHGMEQLLDTSALTWSFGGLNEAN